VNETRWVNSHQPQTLYAATILCYIEAVFLILGFEFFVFFGLGLLIILGLGLGGFGIANEKKWGYALAVAAACLRALLFLFYGFSVLTNIGLLIPFLFAAALVALLLHPMSRDYQRIWFR
jgi:hypothetical protein